ncbi:uncharacterized protein LOC111137887 [Crassostrea virginica]
MPHTFHFAVVLCLLVLLWGSDGRPRSKKTFVPIHTEPDESSTYTFLYDKHYMCMRTGGYHHHPFTCWMYNTTAEEIKLVHEQSSFRIVELKIMQLASSQAGRVLSVPEAHSALHSISNHMANFCHTAVNTTTVVWLEDV